MNEQTYNTEIHNQVQKMFKHQVTTMNLVAVIAGIGLYLPFVLFIRSL